MTEHVETLIVGGGPAGLSVSYYLGQQGHEHLVLERANAPSNAWRSGRWDSFTLVTPNWTVLLPGAEYQGADPDGFMPRDEVVRYFDAYVERYNMPVRTGVEVKSVEREDDGYRVATNAGAYQAANVVMATGAFQRPRIPAFASNLPAGIVQLHSGEYRNPGRLPDGAVLVVGTGQSGCQIAEELYAGGRRVYLSAGNTGRVPRRYRGKDGIYWMVKTGFLDRTLDQMPPPQNRFMSPPQISGTHGGHSINLHQFARDGVVLLGHLQDAREGKVFLAPDLKESLARADKFEAEVVRMVDGFIERSGMDAPKDEVPQLRDGYEQEELGEVDLKAAGITSVIWANGYRFDFSLVRLPLFDGVGYPLHTRGVTEHPGLYFMGLQFLHKLKSPTLLGIGEDAAYVASHIGERQRAQTAR